MPVNSATIILNRQGGSCRLLAKRSAHLRHPLESSLTSGYEAEHKPKQREYLSTGGYNRQYGVLQPHGEVQRGKECYEIDRRKRKPLSRAKEILDVVNGAPKK